MYELHIYGGTNIEREKLYFDDLRDAIETVEMRVTDEAFGWEIKDGELALSDPNGPGAQNTVIHRIEKVNPAEFPDVTRHDSPV